MKVLVLAGDVAALASGKLYPGLGVVQRARSGETPLADALAEWESR